MCNGSTTEEAPAPELNHCPGCGGKVPEGKRPRGSGCSDACRFGSPESADARTEALWLRLSPAVYCLILMTGEASWGERQLHMRAECRSSTGRRPSRSSTSPALRRCSPLDRLARRSRYGRGDGHDLDSWRYRVDTATLSSVSAKGDAARYLEEHGWRRHQAHHWRRDGDPAFYSLDYVLAAQAASEPCGTVVLTSESPPALPGRRTRATRQACQSARGRVSGAGRRSSG